MMFEVPVDRPLTKSEVVRWWELRRVLFNLVLLIVGLSSMAAMQSLVAPMMPERVEVVEPIGLIFVVIVYGVLVNLCYTLGWIMELRERKTDATVARRRGRLLFQVMLAFSLILASGPFWYGCAFWMMHRVRPR